MRAARRARWDGFGAGLGAGMGWGEGEATTLSYAEFGDLTRWLDNLKSAVP